MIKDSKEVETFGYFALLSFWEFCERWLLDFEVHVELTRQKEALSQSQKAKSAIMRDLGRAY